MQGTGESAASTVTVLPVDREGIVNPEDVRRAIRPETVLITIMLANNELGTIEPIEEIGKIAAETGVTLHTDAVQAAGKIPIDVANSACICFPFPRTSSTARRVWARCMFGRERGSNR